MSDVLFVSSNPESIDHLAALASAAQLRAEVTATPETVTAAWNRVAVVVIGIEELAAIAGVGLPRRENVIVYGSPGPQDWRLAFDVGADAVVEPPGELGWLAERVRRAGDVLPSGTVVGVAGCRGGAGASVFACSLALAAVRAGHLPYLLDLDPWGCGVAVILGDDRPTGLTWDQISAGAGRIPASSLHTAVSRVEGVCVIGWNPDLPAEIPAGVVGAVVDAARLCSPLTIIDLGRGTGDDQLEVMARCDRVLLLVPADVRSVHSARRLLGRFGYVQWEIVVRGPNPGGLLVDDVAIALDRPVLAAVAADRGLDRRLERGEPPGWRRRTPLARAGDGLITEVMPG